VLAVFMAGLAISSVWLGIKSEKARRPIALYGWVELGIALTGAASLPGLACVRWIYYTLYPHVGHSAAFLLVFRGAGAALILIVPSFLMGGTLPILIRGLITLGSSTRRHQPSINTFARTQSFTSLAALLFLLSFREFPTVLPPILHLTNESFKGLLLGQFAVAGLVMLPAAVVFGFNFPAVVALIARLSNGNQRPGELMGRAYAANTFGAILSAV